MQTMKFRIAFVLMAGVGLLATSCSGRDTTQSGGSAAGIDRPPAASGQTGASAKPVEGERTVLVQMNTGGFSPNVLVLEYPRGAKVQVRVENRDSAPHGLRIRLGKDEVGLDAPVNPGESASFSFRMPNETRPGEFFSPVGNDRDRGFRGRAVPVLEAPGG